MTLLSEKIVVTAREFLTEKNINDNAVLNEPMFQSKMIEFDWDLAFSAASITCEIVWKLAFGRDSLLEWRQLDKLFSPSPVGTYTNFRGCRTYKTGTIPEVGALAVWKRGNTWQGHISIVTGVSEDKKCFDVIEGRSLSGSENSIIEISEIKNKNTKLPFRDDKLNLMGFIYAPNREIR